MFNNEFSNESSFDFLNSNEFNDQSEFFNNYYQQQIVPQENQDDEFLCDVDLHALDLKRK